MIHDKNQSISTYKSTSTSHISCLPWFFPQRAAEQWCTVRSTASHLFLECENFVGVAHNVIVHSTLSDVGSFHPKHIHAWPYTQTKIFTVYSTGKNGRTTVDMLLLRITRVRRNNVWPHIGRAAIISPKFCLLLRASELIF